MTVATRRMGRFVALTIGVPVVGLGGLMGYISYRKRTRPIIHMVRPSVDLDGTLHLEGRVIPRPSGFRVFLRFLKLCFIFGPLIFLYAFMCWRESWHDKWLHMLLRGVETAGPVFIKFGQWSTTREDLFPPKMRQVFRRLYSEVDTHSYEQTLQIIEHDLGASAETLFTSIEPLTVGSGSIGQVHLAHLKESNRKVVVKVMHPGITETAVKDFALMYTVTEMIHYWFPRTHRFELPKLARAFSEQLAAQLDFRVEAQNLEQFRSNFTNSEYVQFPEPIMSTQRVLVESFCDGQPAEPEFLASLPTHARDVLAGKGLNTWCQMLLRDNFIHGDMHPGNILIDATDPHEPVITLIDVGLCQQLTKEEGEVTHDLMESFVHWKPLLCADSLWRMGNQTHADRKKFDDEVTFIFNHFRSNRNDQFAVTNILQSIFDTIRVNYVNMDPPYVSLLFAVLVLETFIMNLNPEFNMVRHAAPWLISEGHISKGVVKNLMKTRWDNLCRDVSILTGRMQDGMELDKLDGNKNVRLSSW